MDQVMVISNVDLAGSFLSIIDEKNLKRWKSIIKIYTYCL
jgi:hypothetical protein